MQPLHFDKLTVQEQKVLLLRTLGVNDLNIERVKSGELLLSEALQRRINEVINNPQDTSQCAIVCQNIRRDGASYETLDPVPYLEHINEMIGHGGTFCEVNSKINFSNISDIIPDIEKTPVFAVYPRPLVRFFARTLDLSIYMLVVGLCFRLILGINPLQSTRMMTVFLYTIYVCMFSIEPLILHFFGTTPGKYAFGIKLLTPTGEKPDLKTVYLRSFRLLRFGYGFIIPFYNFFRMGLSLYMCKGKQPLPWDRGIIIAAPEKAAAKHIIIYIAGFLAVTMLDTYLGLCFEIPHSKGPLTETVFNDNCAHIVKYDMITFDDVPEYNVVTDNSGNVVSVTYTVEVNDRDYIYQFYNQMFVAYLAMVSNSKDFGLIHFNYDILPNEFKNCFADFEFEYAGYKATNHVEYTGYARNVIAGYLYQLSGSETYNYSQTFTISKIN